MFKQLLANQRVTFVADVNQAMRHSPFYYWHNERSSKYVVSQRNSTIPVAAGLDKDEADACVMFKANEYILRNIQKH
jgi:hypothetical protein